MPMHQPATVSQGKENWPPTGQATQTSQVPPAVRQAVNRGPNEAAPQGVNAQSQPEPAQKSSRKATADRYTAAAEARLRKTQLANRRNPPKPEDIWICEFCDYEAIFGSPPRALVRQYEIKDRKQRQQGQHRKAQLERMKKGKHRGKKNGKPAAKSSNAGRDSHHALDSRDASASQYGHSTHGEEYYEDEYYEDEEYDPEEELEATLGSPGRHDDIPGHQGGSFAVYDDGGAGT